MSHELRARVSESTAENMSDTTTVESRYLSAGANRYAAAADWSDDGLVAFGADSNVCLWDPTVSLVINLFIIIHVVIFVIYAVVFGC